MAEHWSAEEAAATVADYFAMLENELRGEPFNEREHSRRLQSSLNGRSSGAIELKQANISAILIELGYPYLDGYKPRGNYRELLKEVVETRLALQRSISMSVEQAVEAPATIFADEAPLSEIFVEPPLRPARTGRTYERPVSPRRPALGINYLEREARNSSLGIAGKEFALWFEHRRLWESGHRQLAERIEHVSRTKGDGHRPSLMEQSTLGCISFAAGCLASARHHRERRRLPSPSRATSFASRTYFSAPELTVSDRCVN